MIPLRAVEVPDCLQGPQPWWESAGVLPAVTILGFVLIAAVAAVILATKVDWS